MLTLTAIWDCVRLRTSAQAYKLQAGGPSLIFFWGGPALYYQGPGVKEIILFFYLTLQLGYYRILKLTERIYETTI